MINIQRKESMPECLKKEIDYKCGDVLDKLEKDFYDKCYICETDLFSINVEHFIPHKGDKKLKYDWNNLFRACSYCNSIKRTTEILNCTDENSGIEDKIIYNPIYNVEEDIRIELNAEENDKLAQNTVQVLNKVYNGHTPIKTKNAKKMKLALIEEMLQFQKLMSDYAKEKHNKLKTKRIEQSIAEELHKGSKLTAFKRQIIKNFENYHKLKQYFD